MKLEDALHYMEKWEEEADALQGQYSEAFKLPRGRKTLKWDHPPTNHDIPYGFCVITTNGEDFSVQYSTGSYDDFEQVWIDTSEEWEQNLRDVRDYVFRHLETHQEYVKRELENYTEKGISKV